MVGSITEIPAVLPGLFRVAFRVAFVLHFGVKHDIFVSNFGLLFFI